jgi:hypothetical protein
MLKRIRIWRWIIYCEINIDISEWMRSYAVSEVSAREVATLPTVGTVASKDSTFGSANGGIVAIVVQ